MTLDSAGLAPRATSTSKGENIPAPRATSVDRFLWSRLGSDAFRERNDYKVRGAFRRPGNETRQPDY